MKTIQDMIDTFGDKFCIHVPTKEQSERLCKVFESLNMKWASGPRFSYNHTNWSTYQKDTCYNLDEKGQLKYSTLGWYIDNGWNIIGFEDFWYWLEPQKQLDQQELLEMTKNAVLKGILEWKSDSDDFSDPIFQEMVELFHTRIPRNIRKDLLKQLESRKP